MKCTNPITFRNPHYNVLGDTRPYITVPCGRCVCCRNRKRNQWAFRMEQECKVCHTAFFLTLTYDDEHLPYDNDNMPTLFYRDVQLFVKRLREHYPDANLRYLCVGEYGERFGRPHYHMILFNLPIKPEDYHPQKSISRLHFNNELAKIWKCGHVHSGSVTRKSILYCTKYCFKSDSLMRCSKRPFLGHSWLTCNLISQMVKDVNKLRVVPQHGEIKESGHTKNITWYLHIPDIYLRNMFKFKDLTNEQIKQYSEERYRVLSRDSSERDSSFFENDSRFWAEFSENYFKGRKGFLDGYFVIQEYVKYRLGRLSRLRDYERRYLHRVKQDEITRFAYHKENSPREYTLFM